MLNLLSGVYSFSMRFFPLFAFVFLSLFLSACRHGYDSFSLSKKSERELYNTAIESIGVDNVKAVEYFDALHQVYPLSSLSEVSYVLKTYAYYRDKKFYEIPDIVTMFKVLYPKSEYVPYMFYMKAISYYKQIVDQGRDQKMTENAILSLNDVVRNFSDTKFAEDASLKLSYAKDLLAAKEMELGRFYQRRQENIAAINRFKAVMNFHDQSIFVPEALYRLAVLYHNIGVGYESEFYLSMLREEFSESDWRQIADEAFNSRALNKKMNKQEREVEQGEEKRVVKKEEEGTENKVENRAEKSVKGREKLKVVKQQDVQNKVIKKEKVENKINIDK